MANEKLPLKKAGCAVNQKDLSKIGTILKNTRGQRPGALFKALQEAFPNSSLLYGRFEKIHHTGITPQELWEGLINPVATKKHRLPKAEDNKKFANRRDPHEVRRPGKKQGDNWRDKYDHLTITCSGGIEGCRQFEKETCATWERDASFLHVMRAFYMRVDQLSKDCEERRGGVDEERLAVIDEMIPNGDEIPIPLWMASAIADGFKQYVSRRFYDKDGKVTLDAVFKVDGKKLWKEFDPSTIDNSTILQKTRELQWHCGLAFSTALKLALRIINAECACEPEKVKGEIFTFDHAKIGSLIDQEARGLLPSLGAWLEDEDLAKKAPANLTADFLEYIDSLDRTIRRDIDTTIKDGRKKTHL